MCDIYEDLAVGVTNDPLRQFLLSFSNAKPDRSVVYGEAIECKPPALSF